MGDAHPYCCTAWMRTFQNAGMRSYRKRVCGAFGLFRGMSHRLIRTQSDHIYDVTRYDPNRSV